MTTREQQIIKAILDAGHDAEGAQFSEISLHAAANLRLQAGARALATLGEFNTALECIGQRGWMTRITSPITGRPRWNINSAGEAARLEM